MGKTKFRNIIAFILSVIILLISCSSDEKEDDNNDQGFAALENEVLSIINTYRTSKGLPGLEKAEIITTEARKHSSNMASGTVSFGHDGFLDRINVIKQTMSCSTSAENVLMGVDEAQAIVNSWLSSSGHKANIEGSYTKTGIGIAKSADDIYYCTQIFIKP